MPEIILASPATGRLLSIDGVPDPVFSGRMLGDGIAIDPVDGVFVAPCDALVVSVHDAGHAVTLDCGGGVTILIHVGLDTVALRGNGFTPQVAAGDRVRAGQALLTVDLDRVAQSARSLVTPVVVTSGRILAPIAATGTMVGRGTPLLTIAADHAVDTVADGMAAPPARAVSTALRLPLANGLHARPAARVAAEARRFDARVTLVAPDGRRAPADSPVAMLALALAHGARVMVEASGEAAHDAMDAIAGLLASGMDELLAVPDDAPGPLPEPVAPPAAAPSGPLDGVAAAAGLAVGQAHRLSPGEPAIPRDGGGPALEIAALDRARGEVWEALSEEARGAGVGAGIAAAHLAFVDDPAILDAARRLIADGRSAAFAWQEALDGFRAQLAGSGDARFAERAGDLADLQRRMIAILLDLPPPAPPPPGSIVIADDLFPSDMAAVAAAGVAGLATARGGPTSHAAIIAASVGIPMVAALGERLHAIEPGTMLVVDGDAGSVTLADDDAAAAAHAAIVSRRERRAAAAAHAHEPAVTRDGVRIEIAANVAAPADAIAAAREGADGIGLLRTELLFLDRATPPTQEEQRALYQSVADALGERPVIVRTLDIGADKPARYLAQEAEENPALGLRGIRLQRRHAELLETQLRAIMAVTGPARLLVMLPMVTQVAEVSGTRALLSRIAAETGRAPPPLGIMVETPAAALIADRLAAHADFLSIGTNDLTQYTLAADRTNAAVAPLVDGLDPAVLRLVDMAVKGGAAAGRWTGVCGGMAADPLAIPLLIGLGVGELSVPPARVAETKALVRTLDRARCAALAEAALLAEDAAAVRRLSIEGSNRA